MIGLQRVTRADSPPYAYMERLMAGSFPREEYRPPVVLRQYIAEKADFHAHIILSDNAPAGLLNWWTFQGFCYIEHFAIDPALRGRGIGREALRQFCTTIWQPIVLEVEPPDTEMAIRRIGFYRKLGFTLWEQPYTQPPYRPEEDDRYLPMRLMVYGALKSDRDYEAVKSTLYKEVYQAI